MSSKQQDQLQTLAELFHAPGSIHKACALGLIIDSTNAYFDQNKNQWMKKIKIVDHTLNSSRTCANFKFGYCTVMFFAQKPQDLPNPDAIGDIIYLRRFGFNRYNDNFQGNSNPGQYCSWALLRGDAQKQNYNEYQTSRVDMNLNDQKYNSLLHFVKELRAFGRRYLESNSVLSSLAPGVNPKDRDYIVQITKKLQSGSLRVKIDKSIDATLRQATTFADEGQIAKLRSVARIQDDKGEKVIIPNNFTSIIRLKDWMYDAQQFIKLNNAMDIENEEELYTDLATLSTISLNECNKKTYFTKCEIASISANDFSSAVKYYDPKKNTLSDSPKKDAIPIYKVMLLGLDESVSKGNKFVELWVFSYDGKGSNFVERINLSDLNEFSSLKQQNALYSERYDELLQAQSVKLTIQVLADGKGSRLLRVIDIKA